MSKLVLIILFCINIFASSPNWDSKEIIKLKKDEYYQKIIEDGVRKKRLYFRWTLYMNEGLVTHLNYDGFNHQFILYKHYGLNSFRLNLLPKSHYERDPSFMLLIFKDIDIIAGVVTLELYIKTKEVMDEKS